MSDPDMQLLGVVRATAVAVGAVVDESAVRLTGSGLTAAEGHRTTSRPATHRRRTLFRNAHPVHQL
jgi:hypothetical protein